MGIVAYPYRSAELLLCAFHPTPYGVGFLGVTIVIDCVISVHDAKARNSHSSITSFVKNGWGRRIRTAECGCQRPMPYLLAIPQYQSKHKSRKQLLPRCRHAEKRDPVGSHHYILLDLRLLLVPGKGFEPSRRMTLDPKPSASASSAIRARVQTIETPVCNGFWCPG